MKKSYFSIFSPAVIISLMFQMFGPFPAQGWQRQSNSDSTAIPNQALLDLSSYLYQDPQGKKYFESLSNIIGSNAYSQNGLPNISGMDPYQGQSSGPEQLQRIQKQTGLQKLSTSAAASAQPSTFNFFSWIVSVIKSLGARHTKSVVPANVNSTSEPVKSSSVQSIPLFLPLVQKTGASGYIQPNQSSQLTFDQGKVNLFIQNGTVNEVTQVVYESVNNAPEPNYSKVVSQFKLTAYQNGVEISHFNKSISIRLNYDPSANLQAYHLAIYYYDPDSKAWTKLNSQVDPANHQIVATTDHFTLFALMEDTSCQSDGVWIALMGQPQTVIDAFKSACERAGGLNVIGVGMISYGNPLGIGFTNGALVYNSQQGAAYWLVKPVDHVFYTNSTWLGLPKTDTNPNGPSSIYQDETHNFLNSPFNRFENGFIGLENNSGVYEAHRFFPYFLTISQSSLTVNAGDELNPDWRTKVSFSMSGDPIDTGSVTVYANIGGTPWQSTKSGIGPSSQVWDYPNLLPVNTPLAFHFAITRSGSDDLTGYAPCLYFLNPVDYISNSSQDYSATVKCGGGGDIEPPADTTPPAIQIVEVWPDGNGQLSIKAMIVDDSGTIANAAIAGTPGMLTMPLSLTPEYGGAGIYTAVFSNIPRGQIQHFTITASDPSGNTATASGDSRSPFQIDFGMTCAAYKPCAGNPVVGGNKVEQIPVGYLPGPGDSSISLVFTYNGQDSSIGPVGQGISFPYSMSLSSHQNPLLNGVQVVYPDGRRLSFVSQGNGIYTPVQPQVHDRVEKRGDLFVLIDASLHEYEFTASGRLSEIRDANGNPVKLTYEGDRLDRIENVPGRGFDLTYNDQGLISAIDGPEGKHFTFSYQGARLSSFTDGRGKTWTYEYEERQIGILLDTAGQPYQAVDNLLTAVRQPSGEYKNRQTYDAQGRVLEQWVGEREHRTFAYSANEKVTTITDAYQQSKIYTSDDLGRTIQIAYPDRTVENLAMTASLTAHISRIKTAKNGGGPSIRQGTA